MRNVDTRGGSHKPLHHLDVKAETLVDGVGFPPNAGLEFKHLRLVEDEAVLKRRQAHRAAAR